MATLNALRIDRWRDLFGGMIIGLLVFVPIDARLHADVGPCQEYTISVNNLPSGEFNFTLTVNYKYQLTPNGPFFTNSIGTLITGNGQIQHNGFTGGGGAVGGTITSVDLFGSNVPADNMPHVIPTGISGLCDTVVIGPTTPTPPGPCPIVIDIHPGSC